MAISSVRLHVCLCVCVSLCFLLIGSPTILVTILQKFFMKLSRKLRPNDLWRPLHFGWPWARFKVKVTRKPKKLMQCLTAYISLIVCARDAILVPRCRKIYALGPLLHKISYIKNFSQASDVKDYYPKFFGIFSFLKNWMLTYLVNRRDNWFK